MKTMKCTKCGEEKHINDFATPDLCNTCFNYNKSNNVYCINCKHFVLGTIEDYYSFVDYCNAPTGKIVNDPIYGIYKERVKRSIYDPKFPNLNGNCPYYKRSWFKFWIKENAKEN